MSFYLVYGKHESILPLELDDAAENRLRAAIDGAGEGERRMELARRIAEAVLEIIESPNPAPPSERQIKYALLISKGLSLPIPPEALRDREAMGAFLTAHAETYRRARPKLSALASKSYPHF